MPRSLRIIDLHPAYHNVTEDEAILMANVGAICYGSVKTDLFNQWTSSTNSEESAKVLAWTEEGRLRGREEVLESVKARLTSVEVLQERVISLEAAREADRVRSESRLRAETDRLTLELSESQEHFNHALEAEVKRRLAESVRLVEDRRDQEASSLRLQIASLSEELRAQASMDNSRSKKLENLEKGFEEELSKRMDAARELLSLSLEKEKSQEISALKQQVAESRSLSGLLSVTEESRRLLAEKVTVLESSIQSKEEKIQQLTVSNTKSSWAIGKSGESQLLDIIQVYVIPVFLYATVEDMAGVAHAADLHLYIQSPVGKRMKILIDSKKYKDPVRQKEINKLHSDVDRDDDAMAGILISFDSHISNVKQFQIEKTTKGKHVLYLSVEGFDDDLRGKIICWAVRVLSTLASYSDDSDGNIMEKVVEFVREIDSSVKDADKVMKACQTSLDLATVSKNNLGRRLETFRIENLGAVSAPSAGVDNSITVVEPVPKRARKGAKTPVVTLSISEESADINSGPSTGPKRGSSAKKAADSMGDMT